jgi:opacity protein-like surface antigen
MMLLPLAAAVAQAVAPAASAPTVTPPAAAPAPVSPGAIGQQQLPAKGCAAYLWSVADRQLIAMATADPGSVRVSLGGRTLDLVRIAGEAAGRMGFAGSAEYRGGDVTVRLSMEIVQQEGLTAGAKVPAGSLQIDRPGQDGIVVPVAGLIGCRA